MSSENIIEDKQGTEEYIDDELSDFGITLSWEPSYEEIEKRDNDILNDLIELEKERDSDVKCTRAKKKIRLE
jgi:hypothetical protein